MQPYYYYYYYYYYLFTAIRFAPGGSSPTLVQTKMIKQDYTLIQHNTIKRTQYNKKYRSNQTTTHSIWKYHSTDNTVQ
jgi:hypothetical protein